MLHTLRPNYGSVRARKRVARGNSAGGGTTGGRGTKGQQSRVGKGRRFGFEGGQTPLLRRQPKLGGFISPRKKNFEIVTLAALEEKLSPGTYDIAALRSQRVVRSGRPVKILSSGTVTKKLILSVHATSKSAKLAIEKAGGTVTLLRTQ